MARLIGGFRSYLSLGAGVPEGYTAVETLLTKSRTSILVPKHFRGSIPAGVCGLLRMPDTLALWPGRETQIVLDGQAAWLEMLSLEAQRRGFEGAILAPGNPDKWIVDELAPIRQLDTTYPLRYFVRAPTQQCSVTRIVDLVTTWHAHQAADSPSEPDIDLTVALDTAAAWAMGDPVWIILADPDIDEATRAKYQAAIGLIELNGTDGPFKGTYVGPRRPLSPHVDLLSQRDARLMLRALPEAIVLMERLTPSEWATDAAFVRAVDADGLVWESWLRAARSLTRERRDG